MGFLVWGGVVQIFWGGIMDSDSARAKCRLKKTRKKQAGPPPVNILNPHLKPVERLALPLVLSCTAIG